MNDFPCGAILFDLDGVLVSSTAAVARQWRLWAKERDIPPEEVLRIAHGRRTVEVVQLLAPDLDAEAEARNVEAREAADTEGVHIIPGARELLARIPPERWAVVTSGTRLLAVSRLKLGKLPQPRGLVTADDVREGKPHPAPYLEGARLLGIAPQQCLVIEDAPVGIQAAHAAGMKAIALTTTYAASDLQQAEALAPDLLALRLEDRQDGELLLVVRVVR
jgi:mannitol-1-/sugar-/sorbitol-6-phosphatase